MTEKDKIEEIAKMVEALSPILKGLNVNLETESEKDEKTDDEKKKEQDLDMAGLFGAILGTISRAQKQSECIKEEKEEDKDEELYLQEQVTRIMKKVEPEVRALIEGVIRNA